MKTTREFLDLNIYLRPDTTDYNCLKEVLTKRVYENSRVPNGGFAIESGETWLDLGTNIGAFSLLVLSRDSRAIGFEPIVENYELAKKNLLNNFKKGKFKLFNYAVSGFKDKELPMFKGSKETDRYRFSFFSKRKNKEVYESIKNKHFSNIVKKIDFDCLKMDIEGSEHKILDDKLIPKGLKKLVMEYHFTKDKDMKKFDERMDYLRSIFDVVYHIKCLNTMSREEKYPGFFDQIVYCKNT
jgi:FkbM family methyltransferase